MAAIPSETASRGREPGLSMKIGELARMVDLDTPTIRFYESEGVLPPAERSPSGYRMYGDVDADRLRFIKQARGLGLSLSEIRDIVVARDEGSPPCAYVRRLLGRQINETRRQIDDLGLLLTELQRLERLSRTLPSEPTFDDPCICHAIGCSDFDANHTLGRKTV
jgi:DNA-binding transcriptional MerR regulator